MAAGNFSSQASSPASGGSPGPETGAQGSPQAVVPQSFYGLLQLAEDASLEELRQAFRRQSKRLHPDTTSLPAAVAQESFRQLRQAYVILLDPERRRAYDATLAAARTQAGQVLRSSPGAPATASAGAVPTRAVGAGGPGIGPCQNGSPASLGGPAARATPVVPDPSLGNSPGPASRPGNGVGGARNLAASGLGVGEGLPKPDSVRRTLSGGEWFALLLLGLALVFCLVLGVGLAWLRGTELVREPSWWPAQESLEPSQPAPFASVDGVAGLRACPDPLAPPAAAQTGRCPGVALAHALLAAGPDAPLQPSAPGD